MTPKQLLNFFNDGGNILLALSGGSPISSSISSLLSQLDFRLSSDRSALVVDHFHHDVLSSNSDHDVLTTPRTKILRDDVKSYFDGEGLLAVPRPVGQMIGTSNPLALSILSAPETAYSYNGGMNDDRGSVDDSFATGSQISLVSAVQGLNNARFTVVGSIESLEDKWFKAKVKSSIAQQKKVPTVNRAFAHQLTAWTFQERGVLKVNSVKHYLDDEKIILSPHMINESLGVNPKVYRVGSDVVCPIFVLFLSFTRSLIAANSPQVYNIELSEYDQDHWAPFILPSSDAIQVEFSMLPPYYRLDLAPVSDTSNSTIYGVRFTLPDQFGIFSFRVYYKRPFLSNIEEKHEVTVRHVAHDEHQRSFTIRGAWPWITGLWTTIASFVIFSVIWLYSAPPATKKEEGKGTKKEQ